MPPHVLGIGDSVMLGAQQSLQQEIPGMVVDAVTSRQFGEAVHVLQSYSSLGVLPSVVVIHLGTNGRVTDGGFDQMMETVGPQRTVYFLTARVPRTWETEVNRALHAGARVGRTRTSSSGTTSRPVTTTGSSTASISAPPDCTRTRSSSSAGLFGKAPTTCKK